MEEEHRWTGARAGWEKRGTGQARDRTKAATGGLDVDFGLN
jgi:hypothetical protein